MQYLRGNCIGSFLYGQGKPIIANANSYTNATPGHFVLKQLCESVKEGITTRDILTEHAFENAVMHLLTMGGSTNGILHLQAIYYEAGLGELPRFSYTNNRDMLKTAKEHFAPTGGAAWCVFSRCCSALCSISLWRGQRSFPGMYSLS